MSDDFFKPIKTGHVHMEQIITNHKKQEIKMIFPIGERQFLEKKMPTFWKKKLKRAVGHQKPKTVIIVGQDVKIQ